MITITEEMKKDILKIGAQACLSDGEMAKGIAKIYGLSNITKDCDVYCLLGCIYKYGKVQGIREERAKKKKALTGGKPAKAN